MWKPVQQGRCLVLILFVLGACTTIEVPRDELPTFTYKARRWVDARREGYDRTVRAAQRETAKEVGDHDRKR